MRQMGRRASAIVTILSTAWLAGCAARSTGKTASIPSASTPSASASTPGTGSPSSSTEKTAGKPASGPSNGAAENEATRPSSGEAAASAGQPSGSSGSSGERAGAKTPDEQRETLDGHLQTSLAKFDAMLLKEQQEVAAKRAEHGTGAGAGGAGGGAGGEGEGSGGSAGGTGSASGSSTRTSDKSAEDRSGSQGGSGSKDRSTGSSKSGGHGGGGREVATAPEGTPPQEQGDASRVPTDVGDGRDDDVVARQIREAAMAEEDPKVRERLWEEYRRYKRGGS
jgi:hypothetical protein